MLYAIVNMLTKKILMVLNGDKVTIEKLIEAGKLAHKGTPVKKGEVYIVEFDFNASVCEGHRVERFVPITGEYIPILEQLSKGYIEIDELYDMEEDEANEVQHDLNTNHDCSEHVKMLKIIQKCIHDCGHSCCRDEDPEGTHALTNDRNETEVMKTYQNYEREIQQLRDKFIDADIDANEALKEDIRKQIGIVRASQKEIKEVYETDKANQDKLRETNQAIREERQRDESERRSRREEGKNNG